MVVYLWDEEAEMTNTVLVWHQKREWICQSCTG